MGATIQLEDSLQFEDQLFWITGGLINNSYTNNTEFLIYNEIGNKITAHKGPDLPDYRINHCMVKLSSSFYFIIGGSMTNLTTLMVRRHESGYHFIKGPKLLTERSNHVCGTFRIDTKPMVIVSGGTGGAANKTEILDTYKCSLLSSINSMQHE